MAIEDRVKEIANSTLNFGFNNKYANACQISGWLFQKPKFSHNPIKNSKAVSFILFQVMVNNDGNIETNSFSCITYVDSIMEELLKVENVAFITCIGRLTYNHFKRTYSPLITALDIPLTIDTPLEPSYERKESV